MNASAQACRIVFVTPADPDRELVSGLADALRGVPRVRLEIATSPDAARALLGLPDVALLVVHVRRAGDISAAADLVRASSALAEPVKTVIIGERGQTEAGLMLLRAGAVDYLERPLDLRRLALLVDVLTVRSRLELARSTLAPTHTPADESLLAHLAGPMRRVLDQVRRVAPTNSNILLQGETGTGKTRLARGIHDLSPRRSLPLSSSTARALDYPDRE